MNALWKRYQYWGIIGCLALLWFGTLQYRYLISPDEGRYAEIAREMTQRGEWITPYLNGLRYFEKPPLQYWASAFLFKMFGLSEFVARLWPALTGFFCALFMGFVASRLWNKETGQIATVVLLSCVWWIGNGHFLSLDMGLSAFLALSLGSFLLAQRPGATDGEVCRWMLIAWAAAALATLSKGLIGIIIPIASLTLYILWQREWCLWRKLHLGKGILLFLLIAAPWFILISLKNPSFAYFFFIQEHFLRYATDASRRGGPLGYFILPLLVGFLPWLSFLPQTLKQISYKKTALFSPEKFLFIWAVFIFVFFSLSHSKLPSYILPLFPALTLLIARFLQSATPATLRFHSVLLCVPVMFLLIGAGVMYTLPVNFIRLIANQAFALWLFAGGAAFLICAISAIWCVKRADKSGVLLCFVAAGLIAMQIPMLGHRSYGAQHTGYFLAEKLKPYLSPTTPLYIVGFYDQTLPFYLQRTIKLVHYEDEFAPGLNLAPENKISLTQFTAYWHNAPNAIVILERSRYDAFIKQGISMKIIAAINDILAVKYNEAN